MTRINGLIGCLLATAVLSSSAAPVEESKISPPRYELTGYSQSGTTLEIYSAKFSADDKVLPFKSGLHHSDGPFIHDRDNPEDYWLKTTAYLPHCQLQGEGLSGYWHGTKSDETFGNGIAIRNPARADERLDVYFCDNNVMYLIQNGKNVVSQLEHYDFPDSNPWYMPWYNFSPAFVRWAPQLGNKIYTARGNWVCIVEVQIENDQPSLKLDKDKHCFNQSEGYDDSIEGVSSRIHLKNYTVFNQTLYEETQHTYTKGENDQSGLTVHFRQDGQVRLVSQQSNRFPQQLYGTPTDAILLEIPLDPKTGMPPEGAKFQPVSMPTELMNTMTVTSEDEKTSYCYSTPCIIFGKKDPSPDDTPLNWYNTFHKPTVSGKRSIEGDLTSCTSNAVYDWHQSWVGEPETFRDYLFCRFHHSHSGWLIAPTGLSKGIEEAVIDEPVTYIDGYKQEENLYQFTAQYKKADTPAVNISLIAAILPRVIYGEALRHHDAPRKRLDDEGKTRESASLDQTLQIHTGELLIIEAGIGRSQTERPEFPVRESSTGKDTKQTATFDGFEVYRQPKLEDWYPTLETRGKNGVQPSWKAKDRELKDKLLTRIPRPAKGYFDSFSWTPEFNAENAVILNLPASKSDIDTSDIDTSNDDSDNDSGYGSENGDGDGDGDGGGNGGGDEEKDEL